MMWTRGLFKRSVQSSAAVARKAAINLHPHVPPLFTPLQVLASIRSQKPRNFVEVLEVQFNLKLDPRKATEQLRTIADLPSGTGKKPIIVCAFTGSEEQAKLAKQLGCDIVGGSELIDQLVVDPSKIVFEKCLCTEDILPQLQKKLSRVLGPKGLMPSKKLFTVTDDLSHAVTRAKAGQVQLKLDRGGTIHCGVGSLSLTDEQLMANLKSVILSIEANKPSGFRGKQMVKTAFMKSSMGKSFALTHESIDPKNVKFLT